MLVLRHRGRLMLVNVLCCDRCCARSVLAIRRSRISKGGSRIPEPMAYLDLGVLMANLHTKILDFGGFDSSLILVLRGGILMSVGNFFDLSSEHILVGRDNLSREIGRKSSEPESLARAPVSEFRELAVLLNRAVLERTKRGSGEVAEIQQLQ